MSMEWVAWVVVAVAFGLAAFGFLVLSLKVGDMLVSERELKDENHKLKAENTALHQRIAISESRVESLGEAAKRRVDKLAAIREILNGSGEDDSCTS